ncbi:hypothetical protein RP20_CCG014162 [Aedes albopictus]|nr:hypothetical protein RP20_CCG014162 [Aedes albopictus]
METEHIKMEQISGDESETRDLKIGLSNLINQDELDMHTVIDIGEVKTETHKDDYVELSDMPPDDQQLIGVEDMIDIGEVKIESHADEDMESFQLSEVSSDKAVALDDKDEYVGSHKCNLCPKAYRTKQNLRHHIKLIHEPKPFECLVCQVKFLYETQLKKHKRSQEHLDKLPKTQSQAPTKTAVKEKKVHYCSICEQSFATNYALQMHSERHQPGQCDVCQKTFQDRRKLSLHMKHHGAPN